MVIMFAVWEGLTNSYDQYQLMDYFMQHEWLRELNVHVYIYVHK